MYNTYIYVTYVHIHIQLYTLLHSLYTCRYIDSHTYMHTYIHSYSQTDTHIYTNIHISVPFPLQFACSRSSRVTIAKTAQQGLDVLWSDILHPILSWSLTTKQGLAIIRTLSPKKCAHTKYMHN